MKQLTYVEPGKVEWREAPQPRLEGPGQALVQPLAVARCDLDLYIAMGLHRMQGPFALGHESAGEVVAVGDGVARFAPGDRVIVPFQISCGACDRCRRGFTNACAAVPPGSAYGLGPHGGIDFGGALSDLMRVPYADAMLCAIPPGLAPALAAGLSDNVADGYRTVAPHLASDPAAEVLVVGGRAQSIGLYAAHAAVALGSRRVVYTDFEPARLALAEQLGAEARRVDYGPDLEPSEEFPITVDAGGSADALCFALRSTLPCGVCTSVSNGLEPTARIPLRSMYLKGIRYEVSRVQSRALLDPVIACVQAGRLRPDAVVTRRARFDEAVEAIRDPTVKVVFESDAGAAVAAPLVRRS